MARAHFALVAGALVGCGASEARNAPPPPRIVAAPPPAASASVAPPAPVVSPPAVAEPAPASPPGILAWGAQAMWPESLAADETDLYWATARGIRSMPKAGGPVRIVLASGLGIFTRIAIIGDRIAFVSRGSGLSVVGTVAKAGGNALPII